MNTIEATKALLASGGMKTVEKYIDGLCGVERFTPHLRKLLAVAEATKLVEYIEARREADEEEFCAGGATYGIDDLNAAKATQRAALAALDEEE